MAGNNIQVQTNFNAGEWSPLLWARVDLEQYRQSARILQNMYVTPYGGIYRRPGFKYVCLAKDQDHPARLHHFQFSTTDSYILEFYEMGIRVFRDGTCDICPTDPDDPDSPLGEFTIPSPYLAEDLNELQFAQQNDIVYIVHEDYPVHRLERHGDCDWRLEEVIWTYPPLCPQNEDESLELSVNNGVISSNTEYFTPEMIGSYIELCCEREQNEFDVQLSLYDNIPIFADSLNINQPATSDELIVQGAWNFSTSGAWSGRVCIERFNRATGVWEIIYQQDVYQDRNLTFGSTEDCRERFRISTKNIPADESITNELVRLQSETNTSTFTLSAEGSEICGIVRITSVTDAQNATFDEIKPFEDGKVTSLFSESAWSEEKGYPRSVTFHEERLVFGGNNAFPQTLWGSAVDDYENFQTGTLDTDSYEHFLLSDEANPIQWLRSHRDLLAGTTSSEWAIGTGRQDQIITPTNVRANEQSSYSNAYRQATLVNEQVFSIQQGCRKIRAHSYDVTTDTNTAEDVTIYSEHITRGGVVQTAYQQNRDSIYWIVNGCGELGGLTYERQQGVAGWHRHTTQGKIEGVATIYGDLDVDGLAGDRNKAEEEELWITVERECELPDGTTRTFRTIERQQPEHYRIIDECLVDQYCFMDSSVEQKTDTPTRMMTGLEHLEGCEVLAYADSSCAGTYTVENGQIELGREASCIRAGLPYESIVQTHGLELIQGNGTSLARYKQVIQVALWIWKSLGGEIGGHIDMEEKQTCNTQKHRPDEDWTCIVCEDEETILDQAPQPFSGWVCHDITSNYTKDSVVTIRQRDALPLGVLAIRTNFIVTGDEP